LNRKTLNRKTWNRKLGIVNFEMERTGRTIIRATHETGSRRRGRRTIVAETEETTENIPFQNMEQFHNNILEDFHDYIHHQDEWDRIQDDYENQQSQNQKTRETIQEQNTEYEQTLLQDLENQIQKQEKQELQQIREQSWQQERERKALMIRPPPYEIDKNTIHIAFRFYMPSDQGRIVKLIRRFYPHETMDYLYDFVESRDFLQTFMKCEIFIISPRTLLLRSQKLLQEVLGMGSIALHVECSVDE